VAQKRVSQRTADVADARASLASLETELGEALADLNRVINSVLGSHD
jgi:predicted kinase